MAGAWRGAARRVDERAFGSSARVSSTGLTGPWAPAATGADRFATVGAVEWSIPTFADVLEARRRIGPYLHQTSLYSYAGLSELIGADLVVKHENHQPIGAFKVRGGINLVSQLTPDERERGVISASTGNHGQSIAYAARLFGVTARICVPEHANPVKVASMRGLGAELIVHGRDFDEAREHCERLAHELGYRYVHSGNEPMLIAGVGTETLEILEEQPTTDTIFVPVGGGSGAAGACIVAKAVNPAIRVIGVQSSAARRPSAPGRSVISSRTRWRPSPRASPHGRRSSCPSRRSPEAALGKDGCHAMGSWIEWAALPRGHVDRLRTARSTARVAGRPELAVGSGIRRLLHSWPSRERVLAWMGDRGGPATQH
jgi:cysteine synthase